MAGLLGTTAPFLMRGTVQSTFLQLKTENNQKYETYNENSIDMDQIKSYIIVLVFLNLQQKCTNRPSLLSLLQSTIDVPSSLYPSSHVIFTPLPSCPRTKHIN